MWVLTPEHPWCLRSTALKVGGGEGAVLCVYVCGLCGSPLHQGHLTDIYGTDSYVLPHDTTRVQISGGWVRVLRQIQMSSSDLHQRCVFPSASLSWSVQTAALTCRYNILHLVKTLDRNALMDVFCFVFCFVYSFSFFFSKENYIEMRFYL